MCSHVVAITAARRHDGVERGVVHATRLPFGLEGRCGAIRMLRVVSGALEQRQAVLYPVVRGERLIDEVRQEERRLSQLLEDVNLGGHVVVLLSTQARLRLILGILSPTDMMR